MDQLLRATAQKGKVLLYQLGRGIYPPLCMSCGVETDSPGLCASCWSQTNFITGHACDCCGTPMLGDPDGMPCDDCLKHRRVWSQGRSVAVYAGGARRVTLALKHGDRLDMGPRLARWMVTAGADILPKTDIIAPVPLHWTRLLKRRYNQAAELSKHVAQQCDIDHIPDLLTRHRRTVMQEDMTREQRYDNLDDAIKITDRFANTVTDRRILLIDDVMTTGATLTACAQACVSAGATNVNVLVFARVARPL